MAIPPIPKWVSLPLVAIVPFLYIVIGKGVLHASDNDMLWVALTGAILFAAVLYLEHVVRRLRKH